MINNIMLNPCSFYPAIGGIEEVTWQLTQQYLKENISVTIVANKIPGATFSENHQNLKIYRFFFYTPARHIFNILRFLLSFPLELLRLIILIMKTKPQLIHIHGISNNSLYIYLAAILTRKKIIVTTHGEILGDDHNIYAKSMFYRWILKKLLEKADHITACSKNALGEIKKYQKISSKATVIHNGIDPQEFKKRTFKNSAKYIFAMGRLTYNKGFDLLIKAFEIFQNNHSDIELIIAGNGPEKNNLQKLIDNHAHKNIKLIGNISRKKRANYYQKSLFVVVPSRYESFGLIALESLAAGKAVLATKHGGVKEFITDGQTGVLFDPLDIKTFAKKLDTMHRHYQALEKNSYAIAKKYSWSSIANMYLDIYQEVLSQ